MRFKSILPYAAVVVMLATPLVRAEDASSLPTSAPDSGERIGRQVMAAGGVVNQSSANYHLSATAARPRSVAQPQPITEAISDSGRPCMHPVAVSHASVTPTAPAAMNRLSVMSLA